VHAVGCAHDSGEKRNVLIVSICLPIGVGFTLRSNTHRAVKVLRRRSMSLGDMLCDKLSDDEEPADYVGMLLG
jgi:hypothetical protein